LEKLFGLLNVLGESIEDKTLVLAGHGHEFVADEADDVLVLDAAPIVFLALVDGVKKLLGILGLPIILLLVTRVSATGSCSLKKHSNIKDRYTETAI